MTTEEYLWDCLGKARKARLEADRLPKDTPMLAAVKALANQGLINASGAWMQFITRP